MALGQFDFQSVPVCVTLAFLKRPGMLSILSCASLARTSKALVSGESCLHEDKVPVDKRYAYDGELQT